MQSYRMIGKLLVIKGINFKPEIVSCLKNTLELTEQIQNQLGTDRLKEMQQNIQPSPGFLAGILPQYYYPKTHKNLELLKPFYEKNEFNFFNRLSPILKSFTGSLETMASQKENANKTVWDLIREQCK